MALVAEDIKKLSLPSVPSVPPPPPEPSVFIADAFPKARWNRSLRKLVRLLAAPGAFRRGALPLPAARARREQAGCAGAARVRRVAR